MYAIIRFSKYYCMCFWGFQYYISQGVIASHHATAEGMSSWHCFFHYQLHKLMLGYATNFRASVIGNIAIIFLWVRVSDSFSILISHKGAMRLHSHSFVKCLEILWRKASWKGKVLSYWNIPAYITATRGKSFWFCLEMFKPGQSLFGFHGSTKLKTRKQCTASCILLGPGVLSPKKAANGSQSVVTIHTSYMESVGGPK